MALYQKRTANPMSAYAAPIHDAQKALKDAQHNRDKNLIAYAELNLKLVLAQYNEAEKINYPENTEDQILLGR